MNCSCVLLLVHRALARPLLQLGMLQACQSRCQRLPPFNRGRQSPGCNRVVDPSLTVSCGHRSEADQIGRVSQAAPSSADQVEVNKLNQLPQLATQRRLAAQLFEGPVDERLAPEPIPLLVIKPQSP